MNIIFNQENLELRLTMNQLSILFPGEETTCVLCPSLTKKGLTLRANDGIMLYRKSGWESLIGNLDLILDSKLRKKIKFLLWYYSADIQLEKSTIHVPAQFTQLIFPSINQELDFTLENQRVTIFQKINNLEEKS